MPSNSNDLHLPVTGRCKTILGMARLRPVPALTLPNVHCGDGTCLSVSKGLPVLVSETKRRAYGLWWKGQTWGIRLIL